MTCVRRCLKADKIRNEAVKSVLNIFSINDKQNKIKQNGKKIDSQNMIMNYRPMGKRDLSGSPKR